MGSSDDEFLWINQWWCPMSLKWSSNCCPLLFTLHSPLSTLHPPQTLRKGSYPRIVRPRSSVPNPKLPNQRGGVNSKVPTPPFSDLAIVSLTQVLPHPYQATAYGPDPTYMQSSAIQTIRMGSRVHLLHHSWVLILAFYYSLYLSLSALLCLRYFPFPTHNKKSNNKN